MNTVSRINRHIETLKTGKRYYLNRVSVLGEIAIREIDKIDKEIKRYEAVKILVNL